MKLIIKEWMRLIDVQDLDGRKKTGFPSEYIGTEGTASFYMSENKHPGKICVYFEAFFDEKDVDTFYFDSYFRTSFGDVTETEYKIILTTRNSIYTFLKVVNSEKEITISGL